jgi:hypothetical protein
MSMLDNIVTMDESAVFFHMPETKQQSKQWLVKETPGSIKAKVHTIRKKQMVCIRTPIQRAWLVCRGMGGGGSLGS